MDTAQRRVLGLVAIASWLLIDAVRTAGPLLSDLFDTSLTLATASALLTFAAGGVLAWVCSIAGRHFGHGVVVLFMLAVTAVLRLGLPLLDGGWLIATGLYLTALALTTVVLAARVAMGNGGGGSLLAGTALGGAGAVTEQTLLRTWDAVWRADALGWVALATLAALAVWVGWRCRTLEPAAASRGWWAYGLFWSLLLFAFANVAWVNAQTDERMSIGAAVAIISLVTAALLAAQEARTSRLVLAVLGSVGVGALVVLVLRPGTAALVALPIAAAVTALGAARFMRARPSTVARRLGAATVFGLAIIGPLLLVQLDYVRPLPVPAGLVMAAAGAAVVIAAAWLAWTSSPVGAGDGRWIAPGVLLRAGAALVVGGGLVAWTHSTYEQEPRVSADFLITPTALTWNVHYGVTPGLTGGPSVQLDQVADTLRSSGADVMMLQEVERGWVLAGGTDMVEYLAGELRLPFSYAGAHDPQLGNAILTSRAHAEPRTLELDRGDGPQDRSALAVDFMGATFVTAHLQSTADAEATREAQVEQLAAWLDVPQPVVIGADLNATPDSRVLAALTSAGFVDAQQAVGIPGPTYLGTEADGSESATLDYLLGRGVEFTSFATLGVPYSDHLPVLARVATGAVPPTDTGADINETQPDAGPSPSASPSVSPSTTVSPSATASS